MDYEIEKRLISLEGAYNVRDLGGYPAADGHKTASGVFLRADDMGGLSEKDVQTLCGRGVTLSIDLRSPREVSLRPSMLHRIEGLSYENIVMFDAIHSMGFPGGVPSRMGELYVALLDTCQEKYQHIFHLFLENKGVSLFHCTAGKDRTGLVAMLLLDLAGVPEDAVVADYAVSELFLKPVIAQQRRRAKQQGEKLPKFAFRSQHTEIEMALEHLKKKYGGARAYLAQCGVSDQELDTLLERFLE